MSEGFQAEPEQHFAAGACGDCARRRQEAEARRQEAEAREAAEARVRELLAEVERLKGATG